MNKSKRGRFGTVLYLRQTLRGPVVFDTGPVSFVRLDCILPTNVNDPLVYLPLELETTREEPKLSLAIGLRDELKLPKENYERLSQRVGQFLLHTHPMDITLWRKGRNIPLTLWECICALADSGFLDEVQEKTAHATLRTRVGVNQKFALDDLLDPKERQAIISEAWKYGKKRLKALGCGSYSILAKEFTLPKMCMDHVWPNRHLYRTFNKEQRESFLCEVIQKVKYSNSFTIKVDQAFLAKEKERLCLEFRDYGQQFAWKHGFNQRKKEEVIGKITLKAQKYWPNLRACEIVYGKRAAKSWLNTTCERVNIDCWRQQKPLDLWIQSSPSEYETEEFPNELWDMVEAQRYLRDQVRAEQAADSLEMLYSAVGISALEQAVLYRRFVEELTQEETADELSIHRVTVARHVSSVRDKILSAVRHGTLPTALLPLVQVFLDNPNSSSMLGKQWKKLDRSERERILYASGLFGSRQHGG